MAKTKSKKCPHCKGTGKIEVCKTCGGSGILPKIVKDSGKGCAYTSTPCPDCHSNPIPMFERSK